MARATTDHVHLPRFGEHRVTLYHRADVGESHWHMRVYLKSEGRYFRKGLGTHDAVEAERLAQHALIRLLARQEAGQTVLSISIAKLIQDHLLILQGQLEREEMRPATHKNAAYRIGLAREFLAERLKKPKAGLQTRVSSLDGSIWDGYLPWRREKNPQIRRDVVHQELLVIRRMFTWAVKKRLVGEKAVPTWDFKVEKDRAKREDIGIEDAHNLLTRAFNWSLQQTTPTQGYYRSLMFHVLAVMNCSGMRTGEVLHLKRADVGKLYDRLLCDVKVKATNSKSQKTRTITVGGLLSGPSEAFGKHNYLHEWLTKHSLKDAEYVFSDKEGGYVENVFFKTYGQFREYLQQFNLQHLTAYHMRHAFINDRLRAGVSPMVLAAHCGTSIRMISQTYAHISGIEASREIAAKPYVYK